MPPFPVPSVTSEQEPAIKVKINKEWVTFVIGALESLLTRSPWGQSERTGIYAREPSQIWDGDETAQFNADQQIQKILLSLAVGNLVLEDLIAPGATGSIIQSDGENWQVVMPAAPDVPDSLSDLLAPGAPGTIIQSDGSNWVVTMPAAPDVPDSLSDLLAPGANGTVIQSDGSNWIVTAPEFQNLVAKTLAANQVPLIVRAAASQSANIQEWKNVSGTVLAQINAAGQFRTFSPNGSYMDLSMFNYGAWLTWAGGNGLYIFNPVLGSQFTPNFVLHNTGNVSVGSLQSGAKIRVEVQDTNTSTFSDAAMFVHNLSSGTPVEGFGVRLRIRGQSSTTPTRDMADIRAVWANATDATRASRLLLSVWHASGEREGLRLEADSSGSRLGFFGGNAVSKPVVSGSRGGNAALASLLTALANLGLITDSTTG